MAVSNTSRGEQKLPLGLCIGFGVGSFGISILLNTVTTFFMALMTTVLGQSALVAGSLLALSKLYDIVADIVIGAASDRTKTRWGRRRPYLLAGAVVAAVSFLMIFSPTPLTGTALRNWMGFALIVYSTGYALFAVPYLAMAGEMTDGYHERTRLLSFRAFFITFGQITASAVTAKIIQWGGGGAHGYAMMGGAMAAVLFTTLTITFFGTRSARAAASVEGRHMPGLRQIAALFSNRPFMVLMGIKTCQFIAIAVVGVTKIQFLLNVLKMGYGVLADLIIVQNLVSAVTVPAWVWLSRRIGKRGGYLCATGILAITYFGWIFTREGTPEGALIVLAVLNGVAATGTTLMSVSMLPDLMEYDRLRTGERREGVYSSVYTIVEKLGYAIGPLLVGALLTASGFISTTKGQIAQQPLSAVHALYTGMALLPSGMVVISFLLMLTYGLNEKTLEAARDRAADLQAAADEAAVAPVN